MWIQTVDEAVLIWIQNTLRTLALDGVMGAYTRMGNAGLLFIGLSLCMLCWKKTRRAGLMALCAMALGFLCTNVIIKPLVARSRPWLALPQIVPLVAEGDPHSFPSGHTTAAFAAACAWLCALPARGMKATGIILAVLMGFSRLYAGVHYPSDVLAGALVGAGSALACLFCREKWVLYKNKPSGHSL